MRLHRSPPAGESLRPSLLLILAATALLLACGDGATPAGRTPGTPPSSSSGTPRTQGVTPSATRFPPGTVALFDIARGTARSLDMGTAVLRAAWIDDGETVLVVDGYSGKYLAMKLDGTIVREVANTRATTGYEPMLLVHPVPVNDGHSVAISDWESHRFTIVDVRDGTTTILYENAMTGGEFSPDGEWFAAGVTPIGTDGKLDYAQTRGGVFSRDGSCDRDAPYTCLGWELTPSSDGGSLSFAEHTWAPDGKHLLMERRSSCPDIYPRTPGSKPCTPDITFEVYAGPSHELVLMIPAGQFGEARWAGPHRLQVIGADDPAFSPSSGFFLDLDGKKTTAPEVFSSCCVSYSPDGQYAIKSVNPGEDCSLVEVSTGRTVASVPRGPGDDDDTGICQFVSWTRDGSTAIATGVAPP